VGWQWTCPCTGQFLTRAGAGSAQARRILQLDRRRERRRGQHDLHRQNATSRVESSRTIRRHEPTPFYTTRRLGLGGMHCETLPRRRLYVKLRPQLPAARSDTAIDDPSAKTIPSATVAMETTTRLTRPRRASSSYVYFHPPGQALQQGGSTAKRKNVPHSASKPRRIVSNNNKVEALVLASTSLRSGSKPRPSA